MELTRTRPRIPASYGISTEPEGMLEWERVSQALQGAVTYWLATIRPDRRPHTTPIWGSWTNHRLYIEGGDDTRWARNLAANPAISVGVDHDRLNIILNGTAEVVTPEPSEFPALADGYGSKYPYRPEPHEFWRVTPSIVLAWDMSTVDSFARTPTRWSFR